MTHFTTKLCDSTVKICYIFKYHKMQEMLMVFPQAGESHYVESC